MTSRFFGTLHAAAIKGDKEELKSILKNSQYDVNGKDKVIFLPKGFLGSVYYELFILKTFFAVG